ncbi:MAG: DUF86 domain-containing protein [Deltaproteobacteria bacterium]|nr:DUF86 domain-containing protein [Deltaproteobacteria bacterium]
MSKRDSKLLVEDISTAIEKIDRYIAGMDRDAFMADEKTIDSVVRNLEIIGEAARQMPDAFKEASKDVPWSQIMGLRNRIVHDYFGLDLEIIWFIITSDLPDLKKKIQKIQS